MLQKLQLQTHHMLEMQEEPIDFSITACKKKKSWHVPLKVLSSSSKIEHINFSALSSPSLPYFKHPLGNTRQGSSDDNDITCSGKQICDRQSDLSLLEKEENVGDNLEIWSRPAPCGKTLKETNGNKTSRSRKGSFKKSFDNDQNGSDSSKLLPGHNESAVCKLSEDTSSVSGFKNSSSTGNSPGQKTPNSANFMANPTEEYEPVESCETRGLKLTFRRRSTEKSQQILKEKSTKQQLDIPKLIVMKCKSAQGYSLHNGKNERNCKCDVSVDQDDSKQETEILTLPVSLNVPQSIVENDTGSSFSHTCSVDGGNISRVKRLTIIEKVSSVEKRTKNDDCKKDTKQCTEKETLTDPHEQNNFRTEKLIKETRSPQNIIYSEQRSSALADRLIKEHIFGDDANENTYTTVNDVPEDNKTSVQHKKIEENAPQLKNTDQSFIVNIKERRKEQSHFHKRNSNQELKANCSRCSDLFDSVMCKCQNASRVLDMQVKNHGERKPAKESTECSKSSGIRMIYRANSGTISSLSKRLVLRKSESDISDRLSDIVDANSHSERSESAPPLSLTVPSICDIADIPQQSSASISQETMHLEVPGRETTTQTKQCEESLVLSPTHDRPKSSPPICYSQSSDDNNGRKSPVVLLDRLPSPIIELYSMRSMSEKSSIHQMFSSYSNSDDSEHITDNEVSSGEWSAYSGYNSEDNATSSGKLRFTYKKVSNKGINKTPQRFCDNSSSSKAFRYKGDSYNSYVEDNGADESLFPNKAKRKSRHLQSRKHAKTSKRGIRYVNDDDTYAEDTYEKESDSATRLEDDKEVDNIGLLCDKLKFVSKKRTLNSVAQEFDCPSESDTKNINTDLVDPRIKSLSAALIHACQNNQSAEKIAFRSKSLSRSVTKTESKIKLRKYPPKNMKKASRVVDNIRKNLSRSGLHSKKTDSFKIAGNVESDNLNTKTQELTIQQESIGRSNNEHGVCLEPKSGNPYHKQGIILPESVNQKNKTINLDASSNRYRNVFESDVFQLATSVCSELWSPTIKQLPRKRGCDVGAPSCVNRKFKRWAIRRRCSFKGRRFTSRDKPYSSRRNIRCCNCRCRCRGNTDDAVIKKVNMKQSDKTESFKSSFTASETRQDNSLLLYNLNKSIKSEFLDLDQDENKHEGDTFVKQELVSPPPAEETTMNVNDADSLGQKSSATHVKTEITKDTDLMGLDYSLPSRHKLCSEIFDAINHDSDDDTKKITAGEANMIEESKASKMWNIPCPNSQTICQDISLPIQESSIVNSNTEIPRLYPISEAPKVTSHSTGSLTECLINFSSIDNQSYYLTTATPTVATPLFLFSNQTTARGSGPVYTVANLPNCISSVSYLPTLTLNTPLSIQIGHSLGEPEYGSPQNIKKFSPPRSCTSNGLYKKTSKVQVRSSHSKNNQIRNLFPHIKASFAQTNATTSSCESHDSKSHNDLKPELHSVKLSIPKITVSPPSSSCSKGEKTPSTASPTTTSHSCFISPDLPRQPHISNVSRSSSPFISPCSLHSPSNKSPTILPTDCLNRHNSNSKHNSESKHNSSDSNGSKVKPQHGQAVYNRGNIQITFLPKIGNRNLHNCEEYESDDSDATLAYPPGDVERLKSHTKACFPSRRSSVGLSSTCYSDGSCTSALNSPSIKGDERNASMLSPTESLDQKRSELSLIVSDLRENISKTKAMKRSRRTNSFSGENQQTISDANSCATATQKRPTFERFMSVEPLMDSDTPYARLTQGYVCADEDNENFEMLRFVSKLCLQPKSLGLKDVSASPNSAAETQIYGANLERTEYNEQLEYKKPLDDSGCNRKEHENIKLHYDSNESFSVSDKTPRLNTCGDAFKVNDNDKNADADSDSSRERPLVVIENAESDEVIEGDEAFHKMSSGTYKLPTGVVNVSQVRTSKSKTSFKGKRLRISMKSLFTRKSPTKTNHFVKSSNKRSRENIPQNKEKSPSSGYRSKGKAGLKTGCHAHKKYVRRRKKGTTNDPATNDESGVCKCRNRSVSASRGAKSSNHTHRTHHHRQALVGA